MDVLIAQAEAQSEARRAENKVHDLRATMAPLLYFAYKAVQNTETLHSSQFALAYRSKA